MSTPQSLSLGAIYLGNHRTSFRVWAPKVQQVEVRLIAPRVRLEPLTATANGYFEGIIDDVPPGSRYFFRLDGGKERPDPASRYQPEGVHGPSEVFDPRFDWHDDAWFGLSLPDYVIYELHVGTFTAEGTFDGVIGKLDYLKELGITAVEIMPVSQFPGSRNWGYDGVYPFAAQNTYNGPRGLQRLADACHQKGLALILDVVYNHLGPEGNYLGEYGHYFTDFYHTPWGLAMNFDGPHSDEVRRYFIENALYWFTDCHVDALRLDAVHAILDFSAEPFLQELAVAAERQATACNRRFYLIAESDLNDTRLIRSRELGGFGLDAQWADDLHHGIHTLLTGERDGYYQDFGTIEHLARAYRDGFTYAGQHAPHRRRRHGNSPKQQPAWQFVVCSQNHDQIGNRALGDRLSRLTDLEGLKLAAGVVILSPYLPMLYMGEEFGETAPFPYFISHGDPALVEAVRQGRRQEFAAFEWQGELPDPQAEETFQSAILRHHPRHEGHHQILWEFYRELLRIRKAHPALSLLSKDHQEVIGLEKEKALYVHRWTADGTGAVWALYHFGADPVAVSVPAPVGTWRQLLDSAATRWQGGGSELPEQLDSEGGITITAAPRSLVLYSRSER
ncbi:MAG: malto-oligosyltrehalose trehalohydrolase [Gemmataceae bacterium]